MALLRACWRPRPGVLAHHPRPHEGTRRRFMKMQAGEVLTTEQPVVNKGTVENLNRYLKSWGPHIRVEDEPPWEGGWAPVTNKGRITKRIGDWLYKGHGVKLASY